MKNLNTMKNISKQAQQGFTLIELMIVVAIIGILAAVALPAYQTYTKKARFSEVVLASSAVKSAVDVCFQGRGKYDLGNCDTLAKIGITSAGITNGNEVDTLTMTEDTAVITVKAIADLGEATYILTPTANNNTLTWSDSTSSCIAAGLC
ncbi:prepilin-type N-terminal cleavage/methylation domain-containing protein [Colwellia sp. 6_MG-2023]|uniref:pilin n=1 Tax=Colwellia sp. 6_MG-2023 TaxID=3062676 RepID=UPI0026E292A4|nr:prepilin-type N-terminal cleavage/methylation domain-containing protein [Colwellia sp. 6_MG-2023]MDO6487277.1 prepilin-type N-terminal cleavage/methylation domain-containing protein [Colwellia sp. 6_MG-2023]